MELIPSALTLLFQAVVTMMTIGYGDIVPISVEEKIVTVILILIGATMFAYFLGVMSAVITSGRPNSTLHQFVSVSSNLVQLISSKSAVTACSELFSSLCQSDFVFCNRGLEES